MPKTEIHFLSFLANCDESALKLSLDHGFRLKQMPLQEVQKLFSDLDGGFEGFGGVFNLWAGLDPSTQSFYCITNSFSCDVAACNLHKGTELHNRLHDRVCQFDKELVEGYLIPKIRLMRLFKEGNLYLLSRRYFAYSNSKPVFNRGMLELSWRPQILKWSIKDEEIQELNRFIQVVPIPFGKSFLQLAFEAFELSYEIPDPGLAFLSLMIALEVMLTKEREGLSYTLARNTAVLLGGTEEEANFIFRDIKNFCRKRGDLVHTGERRKIKPEDMLELRDYVRKAIKEINAIGKDKKEILEILKACGFSQRPWKY